MADYGSLVDFNLMKNPEYDTHNALLPTLLPGMYSSPKTLTASLIPSPKSVLLPSGLSWTLCVLFEGRLTSMSHTKSQELKDYLRACGRMD